MFSFQIGATSHEEEEETASAESVALFDEVKVKLQETLQFLNQDIGQLVKNAKPIRAILEDLEGKLSKSIKEVLTPAAFIESHCVQVLKAQKLLTDRLQQEEIIGQRDKSKALVDLVCDEIKSLNNTQAAIQRNKADLEAKCDRLLQELSKVNQVIDTADHDLT